MLCLPDGRTEDQIVHVTFPRRLVVEIEVHLFRPNVEIREVVALRGLNLQRRGVRAEMGDDVGGRRGGCFAERCLIRRQPVELHDDRQRENDGPLQALDERSEHREG